MTVSFTPSQAGQHQVSVTFRGKHLQGSPFTLEVVDRPIYHRDYSKVNDHPVSQFGSKGAGDGQLMALLLCAIQEERLLTLTIPTIAFRCLIEMASSCLSLGLLEKEMGSSMVPTE